MIAGSRCPACGRASTSEEARCLACNAPAEEASLDPTGRVLGRTRRAQAKTWVVLVELEGGARLLARAREKPKVGDPVTVHSMEDGYRVASGNGLEP